jgi:hypothetical protein
MHCLILLITNKSKHFLEVVIMPAHSQHPRSGGWSQNLKKVFFVQISLKNGLQQEKQCFLCFLTCWVFWHQYFSILMIFFKVLNNIDGFIARKKFFWTVDMCFSHKVSKHKIAHSRIKFCPNSFRIRTGDL